MHNINAGDYLANNKLEKTGVWNNMETCGLDGHVYFAVITLILIYYNNNILTGFM